MGTRRIIRSVDERAHEARVASWLNKKKKKGIRDSERNASPEEKRAARQIRRQLRLKNKSENVDFYDSKEWRILRYKVLRKFGFCCLACGSRPPDVVLHVDHIKPKSLFPELVLIEDNLQVLCAACNIGKSNLFDDDLRPK